MGPATQPTRDVPLGRLAIIGTGLIGASVGLAAKRAGTEHVVGYDADPEALAVAAERGALDERAGSIVGAVEDAELAVVATPVATLAEQISTVLASSERCTVSDVGSTKGRLCTRVDDRARFIGGHPVCGSEARGAAHASAELFEGATWFLTPVAETEPERYRLLHGFVASLAAVPVAIDPDAHDRLLALTSHLPHALANVVLNHAGSLRVDGHEPLAAAAGGSLRDMTRVAGANPRIWIDIFLDNAAELRSALGEHRRRVEELERALDSGDAGWLARWIGEAGGNRRRLLEEAFTDVGELQRVRVHVPDRPGVLSGITQALGAEQINIEDFELQHLSPERGGTLSVLVAGESEARRAAELLEAQGYAVIVSPAFEDA